MFIVESGLSERPHRSRTWSPRGQAPVLQYHFNRKTLSAVAGVTRRNFYLQLYPGSIRSPRVVEFLTHLMRHLPCNLLSIWDRSPSHRSHLAREYVAAQRGRLWIEVLPAYAAELNPVEYVWGYWKTHELPNLCPHTFAQLSYHHRCALRRM